VDNTKKLVFQGSEVKDKNLKGSKTKQIALEQMKLLATMSSEL
jgi:hypothetical protein